MNRMPKKVPPAIDERAAGVLKHQLGPRGPMAIMCPVLAATFANGLDDAETPDGRVELNVDFQQKPTKHEPLRKIPRARQRLDELLKPASQDRGIG